MIDLSYRPNVLYLASIERIDAARRMLDEKPHDYVLASYLSGLAAESILQAIALRNEAPHDAKHSLPRWLSKCPTLANDQMKGSADWNLLVALWDNGLRYLSFDGLLGYFRAKNCEKNRKGGVEWQVRGVTKDLVAAAESVHTKGLAIWRSSTKK